MNGWATALRTGHTDIVGPARVDPDGALAPAFVGDLRAAGDVDDLFLVLATDQVGWEAGWSPVRRAVRALRAATAGAAVHVVLDDAGVPWASHGHAFVDDSHRDWLRNVRAADPVLVTTMLGDVIPLIAGGSARGRLAARLAGARARLNDNVASLHAVRSGWAHAVHRDSPAARMAGVRPIAPGGSVPGSVHVVEHPQQLPSFELQGPADRPVVVAWPSATAAVPAHVPLIRAHDVREAASWLARIVEGPEGIALDAVLAAHGLALLLVVDDRLGPTRAGRIGAGVRVRYGHGRRLVVRSLSWLSNSAHSRGFDPDADRVLVLAVSDVHAPAVASAAHALLDHLGQTTAAIVAVGPGSGAGPGGVPFVSLPTPELAKTAAAVLDTLRAGPGPGTHLAEPARWLANLGNP